MNRVAAVMHRASLRQSPLLASIPFTGKQPPHTRKRRLSVAPLSSVGAISHVRGFASTPLSFLPYPSSASQSGSSLLPPPTVLYSDNHILAVHKPAGWHSVPNIPKKRKKRANHRDSQETDDKRPPISKKCLLTHLQQQGLGGGSKKDFLVPLHRIDQPCTGVLLFGKTSKAASRVTKVWKGKKIKSKIKKDHGHSDGVASKSNERASLRRGVIKDYLCVVPTSRISALEEASISINNLDNPHSDEINYAAFPDSMINPLQEPMEWSKLDGLMLRQSVAEQHERNRSQWQRKQQQQYYNDRLQKGRSVKIIRPSVDDFFDYDQDVDNALMRPVHVLWKHIGVPSMDPSYTLLLGRTSEGARHMVRALLAQVGECPILGDVRYWKPNRQSSDNDADDKGPLPDRSVALHAYGVYFDKNQLQLGSLDTFEFKAPVPSTWESYFGIRNQELKIYCSSRYPISTRTNII